MKDGALVIDVGVNAIPDSSKRKGYRLVGDVAPSVQSKAYVTPVPGGVGPMTVAMLLRNTLRSAQRFSQVPIEP